MYIIYIIPYSIDGTCGSGGKVPAPSNTSSVYIIYTSYTSYTSHTSYHII